MAQWAVVISPERYEAERLFHHDTLELDGHGPGTGDEVLVLAGAPEPAVVALGRVIAPAGPLTVAYTRRAFDDPLPAGDLPAGDLPARDLPLGADPSPVEPAAFRAVVDRLPARDMRTWLVSVDLPIEADSPAEAVRRFWSYVRDLGPRELPTFVSPTDDELAMQAFVLGEQANLDPEEDEN
jgi:hypothetical protein